MAEVQGPTEVQVQVASGATAGQRLEFTLPDGARMSTVVQQPIMPGAVITVQCPVIQPTLTATTQESLPEASAPPAPVEAQPGTVQSAPAQALRGNGPFIINGVLVRNPARNASSIDVTPPRPTVEARHERADRQAMIQGWGLYAIGCVTLCMCGPLAFVPWLLSAALYFCKSSRRRAHFERQRLPARLSLATCALVVLTWLLFCGLGIMFTSFMHNQHPDCHDGPHNKPQHGPNRPNRPRPNCPHPSHPNNDQAGSLQVVAQPTSWQKEHIPHVGLRKGPVRAKAVESALVKKNLLKAKANMASKMNKEVFKKDAAQTAQRVNTEAEAKRQFNMPAKEKTNTMVMVDSKFNPDSVRDEIKAASHSYVQGQAPRTGALWTLDGTGLHAAVGITV